MPTTTPDLALRREVAVLRRDLDAVLAHPLFARRWSVVRGHIVTAGNNSVAHGLGTTPSGYLLLRFEHATARTYPTLVSADARVATVNFAAVAAGSEVDFLFLE